MTTRDYSLFYFKSEYMNTVRVLNIHLVYLIKFNFVSYFIDYSMTKMESFQMIIGGKDTKEK